MEETPVSLRELLATAIADVRSAESDSSVKSESQREKYLMLGDTLAAALRALDSGTPLDGDSLVGISKWVADWIPEADDPLLDRLDDIERRLSVT